MELNNFILFENTDLLVIDKPAGILVHGDGFSNEETIASWFVSLYPEVADVGEEMRAQNGSLILRGGVVHRLDRDTSGVLLLVKNQHTYEKLKASFQNREIKKEYHSFSYGHMKDRWGTINRPIGRSPKDPKKRSAMQGAKGTLRDAVTHWELIKNGTVDGVHCTELILRPETGRTHQLRVHLKALSRPIVGDALYAGNELRSLPTKTDRLYLHAHTLTTPYGTFTAPLPPEFVNFWL